MGIYNVECSIIGQTSGDDFQPDCLGLGVMHAGSIEIMM